MRLEFPYDTNSHQTAWLGNTFAGRDTLITHHLPHSVPYTIPLSGYYAHSRAFLFSFFFFLLLASKSAPYKAGNVLVTCSHYCCGCPTHLQLWWCSCSFGSFEGLEVKEMRAEMPAIPPHAPSPSLVRKRQWRHRGCQEWKVSVNKSVQPLVLLFASRRRRAVESFLSGSGKRSERVWFNNPRPHRLGDVEICQVQLTPMWKSCSLCLITACGLHEGYTEKGEKKKENFGSSRPAPVTEGEMICAPWKHSVPAKPH